MNQMLCALSVLLLVAVVSVGLMIIFLAAVCVLLTSMKCRRRKRRAAGERLDLSSWVCQGACRRMLLEATLPETMTRCATFWHRLGLHRVRVNSVKE